MIVAALGRIQNPAYRPSGVINWKLSCSRPNGDVSLSFSIRKVFMGDDIKGVIESVVRERLFGAEIIAVRTEEDEDYQGDPIYRVTVIFDDRKGALDFQEVTGLARHLRARLDASNAFLHPVFRFISRSDAKKLAIAAA
jgi:hypothetical protein